MFVCFSLFLEPRIRPLFFVRVIHSEKIAIFIFSNLDWIPAYSILNTYFFFFCFLKFRQETSFKLLGGNCNRWQFLHFLVIIGSSTVISFFSCSDSNPCWRTNDENVDVCLSVAFFFSRKAPGYCWSIFIVGIVYKNLFPSRK